MRNRKRKLNEGTSNFYDMDYFPLLVFGSYDSMQDDAYDYAVGEIRDHYYGSMTDEEIEDFESDPFTYFEFEKLIDEYFDEHQNCALLDESEIDCLEDDLDSFNDSMKKKYYYDGDVEEDAKAVDGERWWEYFPCHPSVEIRDGYYEAAQLYVNVEPKGDTIQDYKFFMQQQIDEVNAFLREMQKKYFLTELGVSYRASNGETGYHKVSESLNTISSVARILKESPMSAEDRKDSDLLNSVVKKNGKNLTDEEQAVLDKYGVAYSDGLGVFQGKDYPRRLSWFPGDYVDGKPDVNGKVNVADKVRKDMSGERDYAKSVWADGRVGDTFDKQERDYQNRRLQHDYATVSSFIGDRRHADIMGANHDLEARRQRGTQKAYRDLASTETDKYKKSAYLQTADDADAMADYHETQRDKYRAKFDRLNKGINDVMNKYRNRS